MRVEQQGSARIVTGAGEWVSTHAAAVDAAMIDAVRDLAGPLHLDTRSVVRMDTTGAWFVERARNQVEAAGFVFTHEDAPERSHLLEAVEIDEQPPAEPRRKAPFVERVGLGTLAAVQDVQLAMHVLGAAIRGPQSRAGGRRFRPMSIINQVDQMGLRAVPVVALMSFLVGGIVAQQAAFQLKYYGEEVLTASFVGVLLLREVGVLLTAIMVAGRTGSAITAEIGTMKMREEIDALDVMGLNPVGVLIFPRILALVIALPLLTIVANFAGVLGALLTTWIYVDVQPRLFLDNFRGFVDFSSVFSGLIKAPFMALIIAVVSAVEGLKVGGSAESLGRRTTSAVVKVIFLVIVVDGLFAIFYATIDY